MVAREAVDGTEDSAGPHLQKEDVPSKMKSSRVNPYIHHIVKQWPPHLAEDHIGAIVTFAIPLKSSQVANDWDHTQRLLSRTLQSVFCQSDPRWRVLICGHDIPDLPEMADPRIEFIASEHPPPVGQLGNARRSDAQRKRLIMGHRLRTLGGGYFMALDADDLVHRDLVATALATKHGCLITTGYIWDATNNFIAPQPGVLSVDFDRVCGSTAVIRFTSEDFAEDLKPGHYTGHFGRVGSHAYIRGIQDEIDRPLEIVPYPAAIYVINNGENNTFVDKRPADSPVVRKVREKAITDPKKLRMISEAFGGLPFSSAAKTV